jgi:hypothetical protein
MAGPTAGSRSISSEVLIESWKGFLASADSLFWYILSTTNRFAVLSNKVSDHIRPQAAAAPLAFQLQIRPKKPYAGPRLAAYACAEGQRPAAHLRWLHSPKFRLLFGRTCCAQAWHFLERAVFHVFQRCFSEINLLRSLLTESWIWSSVADLRQDAPAPFFVACPVGQFCCSNQAGYTEFSDFRESLG